MWKMYSYFSIGNGQPREPALCQLYRRTFVPSSPLCCLEMQHQYLLRSRRRTKYFVPTYTRSICIFHCVHRRLATSSCRGPGDESATGLSLSPHREHGTGCRQSWSCFDRPPLFVVNCWRWEHVCRAEKIEWCCRQTGWFRRIWYELRGFQVCQKSTNVYGV